MLQLWVLNLIEAVGVKYKYERMMVNCGRPARNSLHNLAGQSIGEEDEDCLTDSKASFNAADHMNSFLVLNKGLSSGTSSPAIVGVQDDNWFTKPTNERRSVQLAG